MALLPWGPLLGVWADIGPAPRHGEDDALGAEDFNRVEHGVAADGVFLLELLHRWQRAGPPLALGDPRPEDGR